MPTTDGRLENICAGDNVSLRRTIDRSASGFESGVTLSKAWFTVKAQKSHADPGLVQKIITTSNVPGIGQIENDGTGDVDPVLRFDLSATDTLNIGSKQRDYDVQVQTNAGLYYTPELGQTFLLSGVTLST